MGHSAPEGGKDKYIAGGAFAKARGCGTVVHVNKNFSEPPPEGGLDLVTNRKGAIKKTFFLS